jgi:hypothetical protein
MGRNPLGEIDEQVLEDLIVNAFKSYEKGLWPMSMRHEARNIITHSRKPLSNIYKKT